MSTLRIAASNDPTAPRQRVVEPAGVTVGDRLLLTDMDHHARAEAVVEALVDGEIVLRIQKVFAHDETFPARTGAPVLLHYEAREERTRREEQAAFRQRLLLAYGRRCAVTPCNVVHCLAAAHLRTWRHGNTVRDGILLRSDIHQLFDAGLLRFEGKGGSYVVRIVGEALEAYRDLDGAPVRLPKRKADWPEFSATGMAKNHLDALR